MSEKPESEEFDDDEDDAVGDGEDPGLDHLLDDFEKRKKAGPKPGEPALRRLERRREEMETAALLSDFDDYDIGDDGSGVRKRRRK